VVVLTGPRQSGKTTLLKRLFGKSHRYSSLDLPDVRSSAVADPRGFLLQYPPPVIFDEVQNAPVLLPYIKAWVDEHRSRKGQYILTGSQNLLVSRDVTESLAGRAAIMTLMPLTRREESADWAKALPWEKGGSSMDGGPSGGGLAGIINRGWYPELAAAPGRDLHGWHASYIRTYLEREIRSLRQVGDLVVFQNFLRALAVRSGQLLNMADISRDLGVALNTIKAWLSVLVATHQVVILTPYFVNIGKRLIKTPKVYFTDTGTLCYLAGLSGPSQVLGGPLGGAVFEAAVVAEVYKTLANRGEEPRIHFWRTHKGEEVDLVVDRGDVLVPMEAKATSTPKPSMAGGILAFQRAFGKKATAGFVVHSGTIRLPLSPGVTAIPFSDL